MVFNDHLPDNVWLNKLWGMAYSIRYNIPEKSRVPNNRLWRRIMILKRGANRPDDFNRTTASFWLLNTTHFAFVRACYSAHFYKYQKSVMENFSG